MSSLTVSFYVDYAGVLHQQSAADITCELLRDFRDQAPAYTTIKVEQGSDVSFAVARKLWQKLGDVPCDEDGLCEEEFLHFPKGTDREDIWLWFESSFNIAVHSLMFPESAGKD